MQQGRNFGTSFEIVSCEMAMEENDSALGIRVQQYVEIQGIALGTII